MFLNLKYEMEKNKITEEDIAKLLSITKKSVQNRFNGKVQFRISECLKIKNSCFPDKNLEYLFEMN